MMDLRKVNNLDLIALAHESDSRSIYLAVQGKLDEKVKAYHGPNMRVSDTLDEHVAAYKTWVNALEWVLALPEEAREALKKS